MEEYRRFEFHYGIILLRTRRFAALMDSLGNRRISKPVGWFLLYFMPVAAAIGLFLFLSQLGVLLSPRGVALAGLIRTLSPLGNLGLPGINPYLPIVDGWIALITGMVIHEGAHGIVARSLGLPVKASGLLFFLFVPIGAFVDVDEAALKAARPSYAGRVLAAGAGINFIVGILCLLLMFSLVAQMRPAVNGMGVLGVYSGKAADTAGIRTGDFITAIDGLPVNDPVVAANSSWYTPGNVINITVWRNGQVLQFTNVTLGSVTINDTSTGRVYQKAFLGIEDIGYASLKQVVSTYTSSFLSRPVLYLCIPTLPACQSLVPFSDSLSPMYASSYGSQLTPTATLLYWVFFINFNLAIFNSLPIYPLDGGQAFKVGVQALGRGRLNEKTLTRITTTATLAVVAVVLGVLAGPYLI